MKLSKKTFCCNRGFSMVEVIVAMLVISITVLGTMSMQYHSALDTQRAEVNANAPRIAILLTEAWRGSSGRDTFDPITLFGSDLNIQADKGPPSPTGFLLLGNYKLNMEDVNYFITLSYQDINSSLRSLNATVVWEQNGLKNMPFEDANESFEFAVYVEK